MNTMEESKIIKKKILVSLTSNGENGSIEILEFLKWTKELEPSAAIGMVLREWYEVHAGKAATSTGRAEDIPVITPDE